MKRKVGILVFDEAEVLDFAGPFEVFSVCSEVHDFQLFDAFLVAKNKAPVRAVNGLSVNPQYDFQDCPPLDILILSGGSGTRQIMEDKDTLAWIGRMHANTEFTLSICSAARLLGRMGLLDGQVYCTHHGVYEHLREMVPTGLPQPDQRFVHFGKTYTSGGISAGIDLSFHIVEQIHGEAVAQATADYMEYDRLRVP
ncbi:MAG: DJ-1/PfpI family protein [Bacteroidota bacterium]